MRLKILLAAGGRLSLSLPQMTRHEQEECMVVRSSAFKRQKIWNSA
jgi:hypothetical protein